MMDRTLKAISLLLSYPTAELQAAMPEIGAVVSADPRLSPDLRDALARFWRGWGRATSTTCRKTTSCCSTARAPCRSTCSSMSTAKAGTAAAPWSA